MEPVVILFPLLVVLGVAVLVVGVWCLTTYNRLVTTRNHIRDSWAGVEVELQRRYDLIPTLVDTVKGYAAHERELFDRIAASRSRAIAARGDASATAACEPEFTRDLGRLIAVAEAYPDLQASTHYMALHTDLADTEDRIAAARRFYNGNVRTNNQLVEMLPSGLVAKAFGFRARPYFELLEPAAGRAPGVS